MSGFTDRERHGLKIIHHSTVSLIEMHVPSYNDLTGEKTIQEVWFDYSTWNSLVHIMKDKNIEV